MRGATIRNLTRYGAAVVALGLLPISAQAETYVGDAQVALVTPLSFVSYRDLDFGRVISTNVAGTVTISAAGVRSTTGGVVTVGNDFQVARFAGRGTQNQRLRIQITPTITLTGPGPSMTVNNFTIGPAPSLQPAGASPNFRIIPADGIFWFTVGGTLNVGANQPGGTYSGTFNTTLVYL